MNKKFFTLFISAGILAINFSSYAQLLPGAIGYPDIALMVSNYNYSGSARIQGIGNTQISLGGDISSALSNPAGLGFYNRSEISLTPSLNIFSANSNYLEQSNTASTTKFNIDNIGVVFNKTKSDYEPGNWRGGSFAISLSKINEFNGEINYWGLNANNDIVDFYVQDANRQNVDPADLNGITRGAYENYLMSEFLDAFQEGNDTTYYPFYERTFFGVFSEFQTYQSEVIKSSGSQNQWNFSYGGNYGDVFYFGFTLGIQSLRYNIVKEYYEEYPDLDGEVAISSLLTEDLLTDGIGVNGTFGIIARPINQLTVGFSLITPTYLSLSERYSYTSAANFSRFDLENYGEYFDDNYGLIENPNALFTTFYESSDIIQNELYIPDPPDSYFEYTITTPLRLNGGVTFFLNKNGFISADIEYVDYSSIKLNGKGGSLENDQMDIKELYQSTLNYRVGGEWRVSKLRVRAGYGLKGNPYKSEGMDLKTQTFSGGLGYRSNKFSVDLAASYTQFNSTYAPYTLENPYQPSEPEYEIFKTNYVDIENSNLNFLLSFGLFF